MTANGWRTGTRKPLKRFKRICKQKSNQRYKRYVQIPTIFYLISKQFAPTTTGFLCLCAVALNHALRGAFYHITNIKIKEMELIS